MSDVTSRNGAYYDDLLDARGSVENFLEKRFHRLVRVIRPNIFYSWLRERTVLTQDDQEEVEFTYHTNSMKAGCLIDIIKRKGKAGFVAFMEVVEYCYPELFVEITGKRARTPPEEFSVVGVIRYHSRKVRTDNHTSKMILINLSEMTNSLVQTLATKKEQLSNLEELMRSMQVNQQQLEEENASYYEQLQDSVEANEALTAQIKRLEDHIQDLESNLRQTTEQCNKLRLEKNKFESQCLKMMLANTAREHVPASATASAVDETIAADRKQTLPKPTFSSCKTKSTVDPKTDNPQDSSKINWQSQAIKELRAQNDELRQKLEQVTSKNDSLSQQALEVTAKLCFLQSNGDQFLQSYNEMKRERDQLDEKCNDYERKHSEEKTKAEKLRTECQMFEERFKKMDETIQTLKKELEQSKTLQQQTAKSVLHEIVNNVLNPPESTTDDVYYTEPKSPSTKGTVPKLRRPQPTLSAGATSKCEPAKRQGSYFSSQPLCVYAPNSIRKSLYDSLQQHFETCQYDNISSNQHELRKMAEKGISLSDGKYRVGNVDSLQHYHQKAVLMPPLSPSCIAVLEQNGFKPIVVVIKMESDQQFTELSAIEESLDKYKVSKYEVVLVESKIASDSSKLAAYVVQKIRDYILNQDLPGTT